MTLDSILNWLMPVLIVLFFTGLLYVRIGEPADRFFLWIGNGIRNLISSGKDKATESIMTETQVIFD